MSIIEKLGVTKSPWRVWALGCDAQIQDSEHLPLYQSMTNNWNDDYLIATAPEMLEALIEVFRFVDNMSYVTTYVDYDNVKSIIQKATNKSWNEIKGLI